MALETKFRENIKKYLIKKYAIWKVKIYGRWYKIFFFTKDVFIM